MATTPALSTSGADQIASGKALHTELRRDLLNAGTNHYQRIAKADRLLKNKEWIAAPDCGGGSIEKALQLLRDTCFADLCGVSLDVTHLLDIYHHIPDPSEWERYRFNFVKMWADWKAKHTPTTAKKDTYVPRQPKGLASPVEFYQMTPAQKDKAYEKACRLSETKDEIIHRLTTENVQLKAENTSLKTELQRRSATG